MRRILILCVLVACDAASPPVSTVPDAPPPGSPDAQPTSVGGNDTSTFKSGSRLKAHVATYSTSSSDGATFSSTRFLGWIDTMRNEECTPALAADGVYRCLPAAAFGPYYADAACSIPIGISFINANDCNAPKTVKYVALSPPAATCPPPTTGPVLYAAAGSYSFYYAKFASGACSTAIAVGTSYVAVGLGAEVPPSSFAQMTVTQQ